MSDFFSPYCVTFSDIYFIFLYLSGMASLVAQTVKRLPTMRETWVRSWIGKIPWRRKWQPTPVFLPGKSHGLRSLVGYSPRGRKESDTTERLHFHFHTSIDKNHVIQVTWRLCDFSLYKTQFFKSLHNISMLICQYQT